MMTNGTSLNDDEESDLSKKRKVLKQSSLQPLSEKDDEEDQQLNQKFNQFNSLSSNESGR